ncbi:hypothetical protein LOTGIDRAFT_175114 [Lottia gigantea]|uniref:Uncharacterized protein n=1 Tax=Lottia gigantea TaxID=225164 RepID=V3ZVR3_LOTGI|nr:hypothetical protein LOTGIDRAFT_175114 [Lottia gigantea]ESO95608.1 hypothetical protein LOTGIDRAFT_175114 [Lottia gigantea]
MAESALRRIVTNGRSVCKNSVRCLFTNATTTATATAETEALSDVKSFEDLPGPNGVPIFGTGLKYLVNQGQMHEVQVLHYPSYTFYFISLLLQIQNSYLYLCIAKLFNYAKIL